MALKSHFRSGTLERFAPSFSPTGKRSFVKKDKEWVLQLAIGTVLTSFLLMPPSRTNAEDLRYGQFGGNEETSIRLTENARLRLIRFTAPNLTIFRDAVGFLREDRHPIAVLGTDGFPGRIRIAGTWVNGLILMPNYPGYEYATIQETEQARTERRPPEPISRSDIEKTLALSMGRIVGLYAFNIPLGWDTTPKVQLKEDVSTRIAYNLYDLAPMIDYVNEGRPIADAFAWYYTGGSFFRLRDTTSVSLGMDVDESHALTAFWKMTTTDLSYTDHSVGLEYVWKNRFGLVGAYDFSSYDTYNGQTCEKFTLQANLSLGTSANLVTEAVYRPDGSDPTPIPIRVGMTIRYPADDPSPVRDAGRMTETGPLPGAITKARVPKLYVKEISEDLHAILQMRDRSFQDIVAIFNAYADKLYNYDSSRAVDFFAPDRMSGRDPEDYLSDGGVCIDYAKFIATILDNNKLQTKIVSVGSLRGSPHVYVVARDERGSYYVVDGFSSVNRIDSADSFVSAAMIYQQGFTQMILSDLEGHIESVIVSPEMELLDALLLDP